MTSEEIKSLYSMRDILQLCGLAPPNRAGFIRCPFHKGDREASLRVYEKDYHCFACGANGDIFTFLQSYYKITFKDAFLKLGGIYRDGGNTNKFYLQRQKAVRERERLAAKRNEREFKAWRRQKLEDVCRMLQLCDNAEGLFEPFSDEWAYLHGMKQKNEYWYQILGFGSREEQEEMENHCGQSDKRVYKTGIQHRGTVPPPV